MLMNIVCLLHWHGLHYIQWRRISLCSVQDKKSSSLHHYPRSNAAITCWQIMQRGCSLVCILVPHTKKLYHTSVVRLESSDTDHIFLSAVINASEKVDQKLRSAAACSAAAGRISASLAHLRSLWRLRAIVVYIEGWREVIVFFVTTGRIHEQYHASRCS